MRECVEKGRLKTRYRFQTTFMFDPGIVFKDGSHRSMGSTHGNNFAKFSIYLEIEKLRHTSYTPLPHKITGCF